MYIQISYAAIMVAGIASMAIGFLWYSPMMFGNQWMKLLGISQKEIQKKQAEMGKLYIVSMILAFVMAFVLSHVYHMSRELYDVSLVMTGLTTGFAMWFGFILPVQMNDFIYQGRPLKLVMINTGYQLVTLLVMGVIVSLL
jgi:hypothetical protein